MTHKCPNCGLALEQMGEARDGVFYPDNLFRCRDCKYEDNRFMVLDGLVVRVDAEVCA